MPERCDICGVSALEGQGFVVERIPFRRARLYCPACHRRLYLRLYTIFAIIALAFGCWGVFAAVNAQTKLLDSFGVWFATLFLLQWVLIFPHEVGHAIVARLSGLAQIRILIGAGKPIFSFNFLGFPVLVNRIPFGGLTIFKHVRAPSRWRHLLVIAAGPFVNFAAAAAVWPFLPAGHLFDGPWTVSKLFLAANLLVLVENLLPHSMYTPFGMIGNDGLQLWVCLFRWNKPLRPVRTTSSSAKVRMHQFAKWTGFALLAIATLFFSLFTVFPWIPTPDVLTLQSKLLITAIMLPLALVAGWAAMWTARSTSNMSSAGAPGGEQRMRGIPYTPEQQRSLHEAFQCADRKEFARADAIVDQLMASISSSSPVYAQILLFKLQFILASNDIDRAEKLCLDFINGTASSEHKITVLDGFVASILYDRSSPYLENAERLARLALDMAPETLTLKGSLGGVLAERGKFAEAEPLLVECLNRSPALHDQGISAYYLAVVKAAAGKLKEARSLVKRSIVLHPEPWLVAKAESTLKNWDERGTG